MATNLSLDPDHVGLGKLFEAVLDEAAANSALPLRGRYSKVLEGSCTSVMAAQDGPHDRFADDGDRAELRVTK